MLSVRSRQKYLQYLGLYTGKIDGKEGAKTKGAYLSLQKAHFARKKDIDGLYGKNTDILLVNAYRVKKYAKNFSLAEFKCGCGCKQCTGYPEKLSVQLLKNLQSVRKEFGATIVTSGLRDKKYNSTMKGSSKTSKHMDGKALDIAILPLTNTESGRKKVMAFVKKLKGHNYTYCNIGGNYPNMGNAVHFDVK